MQGPALARACEGRERGADGVDGWSEVARRVGVEGGGVEVGEGVGGGVGGVAGVGEGVDEGGAGGVEGEEVVEGGCGAEGVEGWEVGEVGEGGSWCFRGRVEEGGGEDGGEEVEAG